MKQALIMAAVLFLLSACRHDDKPEPDTVRRMVLVYMEARNDLAAVVDDDLEEMAMAGVPSDCRLLVYRSDFNTTGPALLELKGGKWRELKRYDKGTSAVSSSRLRQVVDDARHLAPSESCGLIMWSHGWGWMQTIRRAPARAFGYENYQSAMSNSDIAEALDGQGLEFIVFDSCFMASVEVAYELRRCADYLLASAAETPGAGLPYHRTLPLFMVSDVRLGLTQAVDAVADYYTQYPPAGNCPVTQSLIDLRALDDLAAETRRVKAAGAELPAGMELQRFAASRSYKDLFFDLEEYFTALGADDAWRAALRRAVVHERHGASIWGLFPLTRCCGLTTFVPNGDNTYATCDYATLQWAKYLNLN